MEVHPGEEQVHQVFKALPQQHGAAQRENGKLSCWLPYNFYGIGCHRMKLMPVWCLLSMMTVSFGE
jgi:hypothetical protein